MARRLIPFALFVACTAAPARAQQSLPAEIRAAADAISIETLKRDLDFISSDALRGRQSPSPGFDSAAAYIARRLDRAGLKPLGDDGSFYQHYDLRDERIDTTAAYVEIAGRRFRFGDDFVMRSFAGPLAGELPVVYVGHGLTVPGAGIDPYEGVDVRGKLVLVQGGEPPRDVEVRQIGRVTVNASTPYTEAERRGAAGIIFIAEQSAINGWSQLRRGNTTRLELHPIVPSAYAAVPVTSVLIQPHAAEALLAGERGGADLIERGTAGDHPASFQLQKKATVHVPLASSVTHRPYNVVAMIEGSDPVLRNEYITVESHLDGAVGRAALDGDSIYNSADDNATGSAGTLSIAEQMMKTARPKRSVIFIWDSGEERGLWGTRYFVHDPPVPLDDIVAHFNIDMIGATRTQGASDPASLQTSVDNEVFVAGPRVLSPTADALVQRVNRDYLNMQYNHTHDVHDSQFLYPRTDAGPFLERGILTINYFTGLHGRYHRPTDEAQYLDMEKMHAITRTVFATVWMLADAPVEPRIENAIPESVPRHATRQ